MNMSPERAKLFGEYEHIGEMTPEAQAELTRQWRELDESERSEEHTSELQSLMRISYAVFCLKKKTHSHNMKYTRHHNYTRVHRHHIHDLAFAHQAKPRT